MRTGLIHVYTGNGTGKTTSAVGLAVRAKSHGFKMLFAQFMKDGNGGGETDILKEIGVEVLAFEEVLSPVFHPEADREALRQETLKAIESLKPKLKEFDMVVLDEFNCVLGEGLLTVAEALEFMRGKPERLELVLTGRGAPRNIIDLADHVTEMKDVKHPFQEGIGARPGIDY